MNQSPINVPIPDSLQGITKKELDDIRGINTANLHDTVYISKQDLINWLNLLEAYFLRNEALASDAIPKISGVLKDMTWNNIK